MSGHLTVDASGRANLYQSGRSAFPHSIEHQTRVRLSELNKLMPNANAISVTWLTGPFTRNDYAREMWGRVSVVVVLNGARGVITIEDDYSNFPSDTLKAKMMLVGQ